MMSSTCQELPYPAEHIVPLLSQDLNQRLSQRSLSRSAFDSFRQSQGATG